MPRLASVFIPACSGQGGHIFIRQAAEIPIFITQLRAAVVRRGKLGWMEFTQRIKTLRLWRGLNAFRTLRRALLFARCRAGFAFCVSSFNPLHPTRLRAAEHARAGLPFVRPSIRLSIGRMLGWMDGESVRPEKTLPTKQPDAQIGEIEEREIVTPLFPSEPSSPADAFAVHLCLAHNQPSSLKEK